MNYLCKLGTGTCAILLGCLMARADVKVTIDHNDNDHATAAFTFTNVPAIAKNNAATNAKFTLVDGSKDDNGPELDVLHDGKLPGEQDQPDANYFLSADGGRIAVDLGSAIDVKQVNSYSWHPAERAAQVYTLYGSDGTAGGFNAAPKTGTDPETCGWKQIAKVDTHTNFKDDGGQYGVSVANSDGALGKFRYLLFVISKSTPDNDDGNTFFSEICVINGADKELLGNPKSDESRPGVKLVSIENGKYTATIDTTETPELTEWAEGDVAKMVVEWYPKLVAMLPSDGYSAPTHFSITFRHNKPGVADTGGTRINCAEDFFKNEMQGQGKGAILHEMVHVVQQYGWARTRNNHPNRNPGYFVEGLCDCIRWYQFEPQTGGSKISKRGLAKANFDGSYRVTANFLHYVEQKYDKKLIPQLNAIMREGNYTEEFWKTKTGKSLQDLNTEWKTDLAQQLGVPVPASVPAAGN